MTEHATQPAGGGSAGLRILDHAEQVPAAGWDALVGPDDLFLSSRWLRVSEATAGVAMNYVLSGGPDGLTGGLATALVPASAPWLLGRPDTVLARCADDGIADAADCRAALPENLTDALMPSLVCGGRHLGRTRTLVADGRSGRGAPGMDTASQIDALVAAAERLAWAQEARCTAFLYVDERDTLLRQVLTRRGYVSFLSSRYSLLPVPADGFTGYMGTLSAHRRARIKADRRRIREAGLTMRLEPLTDGMITRLAELETALLTKYGADTSPAKSEPIFAAIRHEFGADAVVFTARMDGNLCGSALFLRRGDHWHGHRGGFDYVTLGNLPLYFEVAFYQPVEAAAAAGITTIHYGIGSAETKRSRGCTAVDQYAFLLLADAARTWHRPGP